MNAIFGANWKTRVSGIGTAIFSALTVLAALPYSLGDLATVIPPSWKAKIVVGGLVGAFGLRVWNSVAQKSKEVTGGTVQQDTTGATASPHAQATSPLIDATREATSTVKP
jgi:hypothetical protein